MLAFTGNPTKWLIRRSSDNLGTVRDLAEYDDGMDETTIVDHYVYDAFGNETDHSGSNDFLFKYTGRAFDAETGLQNNLNRWFYPTVGRWLSEDPIGFEAGDANVYRYVGNFSTGATDPSGLMPNRANARTIEQFIARVRDIERKYKDESPREILIRVRDSIIGERRMISGGSGGICSPPNHDGVMTWSYVYTEEAGWIDMAHFVESARWASWVQDHVVRGIGAGVEILQYFDPRPGGKSSAFTPEDLSSNKHGAAFGDGLRSDALLSDQLLEYFRKLGATKPSDAPDYDSLPASEAAWEKQCQERLDENRKRIRDAQDRFRERFGEPGIF